MVFKNSIVFILYYLCLFSETCFCHKKSLIDPDLKPEAGTIFIHPAKTLPDNFLEGLSNSVLLYHQSETLSLLSSDNGFLEVNFAELKLVHNISNFNFFVKKGETLKPHGFLNFKGSGSFYFCNDSRLNPEPPLLVYQKGSWSQAANKSWPQNYCSSNKGENFLVISGKNKQKNTLTTVELWRGGQRIREFYKSRSESKLSFHHESKLLALVGGFMKGSVAFYMSRERISSDANDVRAYVNRISKVCNTRPKNQSDTLGGLEKTRNMAELKCSFYHEKDSSLPSFVFSRLVATHYDITSNQLFALYNTWPNAPEASALCVHRINDIRLEKCENELTSTKPKNIESRNPIFLQTREDHLLSMFSIERLSYSSSNFLMFFASQDGVILKTLVNPETYSTTVIAKFLPSSQPKAFIKQIEIVGERLFVAIDHSRPLLLEKHGCQTYICRVCEKDPFCSWNETSQTCVTKASNGLTESELKIKASPNSTFDFCPEAKSSSNISPSRLTVLAVDYLGQENFGPENLTHQNSRPPTSFEQLVLDLSENRELALEFILVATPSLVLGLICGVFATYGIAGVIVTRRRKKETAYEATYPRSNYRTTGSENNGSTITRKNAKTYPVQNVVATDAQETFLRPPYLQSTSSSSAPMCHNEFPPPPSDDLSPQYSYIPNEGIQISSPEPDVRPPTPQRANMRPSVASRVPYVKCAIGNRRRRRMSDNSALLMGPVNSTSEFGGPLPSITGSPASEQSLYTFQMRRPRKNEDRKVSQSSSQSSTSDNVFTSFSKV